MNVSRYVLAVLVAFAVIFGYDYLVHGVLMMDQYQETIKLWRPQAPEFIVVMAASQFLYAIMFVFIFTRNYENLGLAEGLRFGLYIGALLAALTLGMYAFLPVPFKIVAYWMLADLIKGLLVGAVTAAVYRQ